MKVTHLKKKIQHLEFCGGGLTTPHPSSFRSDGLQVCLPLPKEVGDRKILLPSARHLKEGRGTTISELLRLENCKIARCAPDPLGAPPPPTPSVKMAKSSRQYAPPHMARGHMGGGGGATGGTWSWEPRPPPWVRGSIYKKKVLRTQVQIHTQQPQYAKKF